MTALYGRLGLLLLLLLVHSNTAMGRELFDIDSFLEPHLLYEGSGQSIDEGEEGFLFAALTTGFEFDDRFRNEFLDEDLFVLDLNLSYHWRRYQFDLSGTLQEDIQKSSDGDGHDPFRFGAKAGIYFGGKLEMAPAVSSEREQPDDPTDARTDQDRRLDLLFENAQRVRPEKMEFWSWARVQAEWKMRDRGTGNTEHEIGVNVDTAPLGSTGQWGFFNLEYIYNEDKVDHFFSSHYTLLLTDAEEEDFRLNLVLSTTGERVGDNWNWGVFSPGVAIHWPIALFEADSYSGLSLVYAPAYQINQDAWNHEVGLFLTLFMGDVR